MRQICPQCISRVCPHYVPEPHVSQLTPRERDVAKLLKGGLSNKEIGEYAELTPGTVKIYVHRICLKLGLVSRLEVALWALKHGEMKAE